MAINKRRIKAHAVDGLISFLADERTRTKVEFIKKSEGLSISMICRLSLAILWEIYERDGGRLPVPSGASIDSFKKSPGRLAVYTKKREELSKDVSKE